jgi:hypothetical protein
MSQGFFTTLSGNINGYPNYELVKGTWSHDVGGYGLMANLLFYTTEGEVRPINTAVKIWKRTG